MADNINDLPSPSSLPTQSGELIYGPDLIPVSEPHPTDWDPSVFKTESNPTSNANPFLNLQKGFDDAFYKSAEYKDYGKLGAPTPFNAESTLFDRFASSWDFDKKGFIPWRDNDDTYNQDTNVLKELYRSSKWAAPLFGEGFKSGLRLFPDLIAGAYNGDWDRIIKSDDYLAEKWSRATKMGSSTAGGASSFLTNFEISAANMVGMVIETVAEDALIGFATVATGGAAAPLAALEVGKTAGVFASIWKGLKNINKIVDIFKEANNARRFYEITLDGAKAFGAKTFKNTVNFLNPLENTIGGFGKAGFIKDFVNGENHIKNASALGKTVQGFGSFYRDLREINFALTEAKLEGGFSYLERSNQMTNDFITKNGYAPQGKDAQDIEANSRAGGDFTTQANLPIIYFSNRFGFGNLFKGWKPLNKLMSEAESGASLFKNISFNNAKKLFEEVKDFSVKRAFNRGVGGSLNYFKANFMEGIQENLQDVIQGAASDYYDKQFKNPSYGGYMVMMGDVKNQFGSKVFTGQGFETFASGAMMGLVVQGGIKAKSGIQNLTYRVTNKNKYAEFKTKRSEQINKYVTQLNEMYQDPSKYLDPQLMNAVRQGELSKYLSQSVKNSNKKEFYDIKDQSVYEHLWTMARSGKSEVFKERLEEMKQLKPEEFENALGFTVENPTEFKSYIDDQIKKVDQIKSLYDKANNKLKNPINLGAFKKDTKEYNAAATQYMAFENAKQQAVFANYSFMRNAERMEGLLGEMNKNKLFTKNTSYTDLSLLTDPDRLDGELAMLKQEIDNLTEGVTDEKSRKLVKDKQKLLKTLEIWHGTMNSPQLSGNVVVATDKQKQLKPLPGRPQTKDFEGPTIPLYPVDYPSADNSNYDNWRRAAKLAFENLVETDAAINKDSAYRESINNVFDLIMDYHTLGRESKGMLEIINILADPTNFLKLYEGHFTMINDLIKNRSNKLKEALLASIVVNDKNGLVNMLAYNNYLEDPEKPGTYLKISDWSSIEPDSEDATKIKEIIADYEAATNNKLDVDDIEAKKADIERRRQEELDKTNAQLETIEKNGDSFIRVKVEVYTTLGNEETLNEVEIITFKDGSRRIRATDAKTGGIVLEEKIKKDNSTTNEKFIEDFIGNLDNSLKKISEDSNPNKTVIDKINAKYDAELAALEKTQSTNTTSSSSITPSTVKITTTPEGDVYLIENEGVNYEVFANEPTLFFIEIQTGDLDAIKNEDVPDIVKSELDKYIKAKTPAQQPASTKSILPGLLVNIEQEDDINKILLFEKYLDPAKKEYKLLTDGERKTLAIVFSNKINILLGKTELNETDDNFTIPYNQAIAEVKELLKKPGLTEDNVKTIFDSKFIPIINTLKDKAVKAKYRGKMKAERDFVITRIQNNKKAKDVNALKIIINDIFKNNVFLTDIENAASIVFTNIVSPEIKEQIIEHFTKELEKKFQAEISSLEQAAGSIENDEVAKKYIAHLDAYKQKIQTALDRFKKQAEEIAEKTVGISLAVDIDEDYMNDVHRGILGIDAFEYRKATGPQIAALENLITSGILLSEEVNFGSLTIHDASALVNKGVARIYIIGINKGIITYLKHGKIELLEKELTEYLDRAKDDKTSAEIKDDVKNLLEEIKVGEQTAGAILNILNIDETAEIGDEEFKLLRLFRTAIYNVQTETELLESITNLQDKQQQFISKGQMPSSLEELLDENDVKVIRKFLTKQKGVKVDIGPFYDDLLEIIEKIQSVKDVKEVEKLIKELVRKYSPPAKAADASNLIKAFIGNILETQGLLSGQIELGEELTDDEILRILNGEKRTLTPSQIRQVNAYEKDLIEFYKTKFSEAPGYVDMLIEYDAENLEVTGMSKQGVKFLALREKDKEDLRTTEDLISEYDVVENKINIKNALQKIIDGDFSTDGERELARILMDVVGAEDTMDVNNNMRSAGEWDPVNERASINLLAVGYKEDFPSNPIETVILHELLHAQIEKALQEPNGEYTKAMRSLFAAVKGDPRAATFYAFQPGMQEDEQLREFVVEAFTNPAFQHLLASLPYAKSGKSIWVKFMDILSNLLKSIGIDIEGSTLNEVINQTTELIKFDYTEKTLKRLSEIGTEKEIDALKEEINKESNMLTPNISESILSALEAKRNSILANKVSEEVKTMTQIKVDGKTYYIKIVDGYIALYRRTNKKLIKVTQPAIIDAFIKNKLKEGNLENLIGKDNIKILQSLMGDPSVRGTYASGEMNDIPLTESRLKNAAEASVVLKFADIAEFNEFRRHFWKFKSGARDAKYRSIQALRKEYPGRGVNSFDELVEGFGGLDTKTGVNNTNKKFDRLIKKGILKVDLNGSTHEDFTHDEDAPASYEDFVELYEMILNGVSTSSSDKEVTRININKTIGDFFGVGGVSQETQDVVENIIRSTYAYDLEEDLADDEEITELEMEGQTGEDFFDGSTQPDTKKGTYPSDFDSSTTEPEKTITAVNTNALRSHPFDIYRTGQETPEFIEFYHKIRNIINILSLKDLSELADIYVTLEKDSEGLRWDGSAQNKGWIGAPKGLVGYLSDYNGNPLIISPEGKIIGKLDKANLADKKGLDNGANQIVYFTMFTEKSNTEASKLLTPESKEKLLAAREKVNQGNPQIAKIVKINQGEMNKKSLTRRNKAGQANTKNADFYSQISQSNITFEFNDKGDIIAILDDKNGAVNRFGLFPPNTKNVIWEKNGIKTSLFDHLISAMVTIQEMKLRGVDVSNLENDLAIFVRNMWLTGENYTLQIPKNFERIRIKPKGVSALIPLQILNIKNGVVTLNPQNVNAAKVFMENMSVNISKAWWSGKTKFKFPKISEENGVKVLKFVDMDYKNFMFKQIGLSSYVTEIPNIDDLKRYNSTIVFTEPTDLVEKIVPSVTITEQQLLDNQNVVNDKVDDAIKNSKDNSVINKNEIEALKKKKRFRAPSYDQIFEKTCK